MIVLVIENQDDYAHSGQVMTGASEIRYDGPFVLEFPERFLGRAETCLAPALAAAGRAWPKTAFKQSAT